MFDFRARFLVQSAKGPYVGYGVRDADSGRWLTEVDLPADEALAIAATLMAAAAPRELRHAGLVRVVVPPRAVLVASRPGILAAWAAGSAGWVGFALVDGEMKAEWIPAAELQPEAKSAGMPTNR